MLPTTKVPTADLAHVNRDLKTIVLTRERNDTDLN